MKVKSKDVKSSKKKISKKVSVKKVAPAVKGKVKKIIKVNNQPQATDLTYKYRGNGRWVIFQLKEECDISENYVSIEQELKLAFGDDIEYFIPVYREKIDNNAVGLTLFDGYIFVRFKQENSCELNTGEYKFLEGPLMKGGKVNYASDKEINALRTNLHKRLQKRFPRRGQTIVPKSGTFKNLEGKVIGIDRKNRVVRAVFKQSSREVEADINVINLDFDED